MLRALIVAVVGAIPSLALILIIERGAQRVIGAPLARWRRLLIPAPIILALAGFGIPALVTALRSFGGTERPVFYFFWSFIVAPYLALLVVVLLPFFLGGSLRNGLRLIPGVWGYHVLWVLFPYLPWVAMVFGD